MVAPATGPEKGNGSGKFLFQFDLGIAGVVGIPGLPRKHGGVARVAEEHGLKRPFRVAHGKDGHVMVAGTGEKAFGAFVRHLGLLVLAAVHREGAFAVAPLHAGGRQLAESFGRKGADLAKEFVGIGV